MVCAAVFGTHVVCASARVWSLPGDVLPSQHRRRSTVFRVVFQQTNKQTNKQSLVQSLGWVFENKERKKERKTFTTCQDVLGYAIRYAPIPRDTFLGPMWLIGYSPFVESSDWRVFYTRKRKKERVEFHKKTMWCNLIFQKSLTEHWIATKRRGCNVAYPIPPRREIGWAGVHWCSL